MNTEASKVGKKVSQNGSARFPCVRNSEKLLRTIAGSINHIPVGKAETSCKNRINQQGNITYITQNYMFLNNTLLYYLPVL